MAGCTTQYNVTFSETDKTINFVQNIDIFLRSQGFIPDSTAYDFDRNDYTRMIHKYNEFIDTWRFTSTPQHLFDDGYHISIFLWKDTDNYLLEIIPGNGTYETFTTEYLGLVKGWIYSNYPDLKIEIRNESFVDFR